MAAARDSDPIGAVQAQLTVHSKAIADTLYGIQQLKSHDAAAVAALATQLNASAARLDAAIDALPEYDLSAAAVRSRIAEHSRHYAARAEVVESTASVLVEERVSLAKAVASLGTAPR